MPFEDNYSRRFLEGCNARRRIDAKSARRKKILRYAALVAGIPLCTYIAYLFKPVKEGPKERTADEILQDYEKSVARMLEESCSNADKFYNSFKAGLPGGRLKATKAATPKLKKLFSMLESADAIVYHHILEDESGVPFAIKRCVTTQADIKQDLERRKVAGRPLIVVAPGLTKEQFDILSGALRQFKTANPGYPLQAVFCHSKNTDLEAQEIKDIAKEGWINGYTGIPLGDGETMLVAGKDGEKVRVLNGPGDRNMSPNDVRLYKDSVRQHYEGLLGKNWWQSFEKVYCSQLGILPDDQRAVEEMAKLYDAILVPTTVPGSHWDGGKFIPVAVVK